jgi:cephalosporin hydroxylase
MSPEELVTRALQHGAIQDPRELHALATFVAGLRPRHVLEIGTAYGGTFSVWCNLASGTPISLDLPWQPDTHERDLGVRPEHVALRSQRFLQWNPRAVEIVGDSHDPASLDRVREALEGEPLDFLFIDGDHRFDGVRQDWEMYSPLVRPGGWVAFHDILDTPNTRRHGIDVWHFWRALRDYRMALTIEIVHTGEHSGVGLIQI